MLGVAKIICKIVAIVGFIFSAFWGGFNILDIFFSIYPGGAPEDALRNLPLPLVVGVISASIWIVVKSCP